MALPINRRTTRFAWLVTLLGAAIIPLVLVAQNAGRGAIQTPGGGRGPGAAPDANDPANANADLSPKPPVVAMTPEEEAKRFWLPAGYRLTPILSEPIIEDPAQIAFDGNGRMFVVELRGYYQSPEGIDLVPSQLGTGRKMWTLLGEHALETQHEPVLHLPPGRRAALSALDLRERVVQRAPARGIGREYLARVLALP